MEFFTHNDVETEAVGESLGAKVQSGDVIALFGGLGAGKTAFIRGLAKGMGISTRVVSPTFTIVNEYDGPLPLFHFDMYRLSTSDELFDIGWEDYLNRRGVCAVEWSENVSDALDGSIKVNIEHLGNNDRLITITGVEM